MTKWDAPPTGQSEIDNSDMGPERGDLLKRKCRSEYGQVIVMVSSMTCSMTCLIKSRLPFTTENLD
jgi:hypothetical protein